METRKNWMPVIVVALGYFVDLYDLLLFSSVRVTSLKEIGMNTEQSTYYASNLLNWTVWGMLFGGFFWGILADKKGRLSVLFFSIACYTAANFINAFISNIHIYQWCRFLAGFGIAGELGVGITLISEVFPKNKRSLGTALITAMGMLGAVAAGLLSYFLKDSIIWGLSGWRFLFVLGGIFGLCLLLFRLKVSESEIFNKNKNLNQGSRGSLMFLLTNSQQRNKFLKCIASGLPVFLIIGIFISLAPEFGKRFGVPAIQPALAVMWCYASISIFDFLGALLSKKLQSRKVVLLIFLSLQLISVLVFLFVPITTAEQFYFKCAFLGMGIGYWGVMVVNSAEQFGTDLRATVTTAVPNLIRFALVPFSVFIFSPLKPLLGITGAGGVVVILSIIIAFLSVLSLKDKFEINTDFNESKL